jgi:hypothetical protein
LFNDQGPGANEYLPKNLTLNEFYYASDNSTYNYYNGAVFDQEGTLIAIGNSVNVGATTPKKITAFVAQVEPI